MSIQGDLVSIRLPDILQLLNSGQNTGILIIRRQQWLIKIVFIRGEVIEASSNREEYRLEHFLIQRDYLPSDQLSTIETGIAERGRAFEAFLKSNDFISHDELVTARQELSREIIYDLFSWNDGEFEFDEHGLKDAEQYKKFSPLNIYQLIMEGVRRIDEWQRIRQVVENEGLIFDIAGGDERPLEGMKENDLRVLSLVNGQRTVRDVCLKNPTSCFDTCHTLYSLYSTGLIMVVGQRNGIGDSPSDDHGDQPHDLVSVRAPQKKGVLVGVGLAVLSVLLIVTGLITDRFMGSESENIPGQDTSIQQLTVPDTTHLPGDNSTRDDLSRTMTLMDRGDSTAGNEEGSSRTTGGDLDRTGLTASPLVSGDDSDDGPQSLSQSGTDGRININTASVQELVLLPRIGPKLAERIIAWRETNGDFKTIESLMEVNGIGTKTFEQLEDAITVGQ